MKGRVLSDAVCCAPLSIQDARGSTRDDGERQKENNGLIQKESEKKAIQKGKKANISTRLAGEANATHRSWHPGIVEESRGIEQALPSRLYR